MPIRDDFELGGTRIAPGRRKTVELPISTLSDHTPVNMSVHVIHGRRPGPTLFVSAGIHGDEVIGVEIVRRLLRAENMKLLRGTLLVIPIVNAFGFLNRSRYLPDRRDLNRCFPGSAGGSLASRMAHLFLTEVVAKCEFGIDLHSAAVNRTNLPQIRISPDTPSIMARAKVFGAPAILRSPLREGSLRAAAREIGVDVLLFEAGEGLRFDEMSVRAGVAGIMRVMHDMGSLPSKGISRAKAASIICSTSKWVRAPAGGLLRTFKEQGEVVSNGDLLAAVCDPFGNEELELFAEFDGLVVGRAVMPVVNEGDAIYHIAKVASPEKAENAVEDLNAQLEVDPLFDEDEII